jgi:hypothetical protein
MPLVPLEDKDTASADRHAIEVLAREAADRIIEAMELRAERDGRAVYEHLEARRCHLCDRCFLFYEVAGEDAFYKTREQAIQYVAAHKAGSVWT